MLIIKEAMCAATKRKARPPRRSRWWCSTTSTASISCPTSWSGCRRCGGGRRTSSRRCATDWSSTRNTSSAMARTCPRSATGSGPGESGLGGRQTGGLHWPYVRQPTDGRSAWPQSDYIRADRRAGFSSDAMHPPRSLHTFGEVRCMTGADRHASLPASSDEGEMP